MKLGHLHTLSLCTVAALGPLGVMSGSPLLLGSGAALIAAILYSSLSFNARERSVERSVVVHTLTVVALVGAVLVFRRARIDSVLIVLMLGVFNRVLLRAKHRDDLLLIGTSATLTAAATTVSPGVEFLALMLVLIPAVTIALWSSMLVGAFESAPAPAYRAALERTAPQSMIRRGAALTLVLTIVGTIGFTLFPRYKFSRIFSTGAFIRLPGASDSMSLDVGGLSEVDDATVVMRLYPTADMASNVLEGLYARMYVLDDFDGQTWHSSRRDEGRHPMPGPSGPDRAGNGFSQADAPKGRPDIRVALERVTRDVIHPVAALGFQWPAQVNHAGLREDLTGGWSMPDNRRDRRLEYEVTMTARAAEPRFRRAFMETRIKQFTRLPEAIDPRVRALAAKITRGETTTHGKVEAVLRYLSKGFRYSLDPLEGDFDDPLARFLLEAKHGHCELYAGAMAVLLRLAGERTRVATGYYGGRWNRIGGYHTFARSDAHAWTEVYYPDEGWRWVDATPEDLRSRRRGEGIFSMFGDWYETLSGLWFDRVVDFDAKQQRKVYRNVSGQVASWFSSDGEDGDSESSPRVPVLGGLAGVVILAAGALGLLFSARRRRSPEWLGRRLRRALGASDDANVTLGVLLETQDATVREAARRAVRAYEAYRFGPHAGDAALREAARSGVEALENAIDPGPARMR